MNIKHALVVPFSQQLMFFQLLNFLVSSMLVAVCVVCECVVFGGWSSDAMLGG